MTSKFECFKGKYVGWLELYKPTFRDRTTVVCSGIYNPQEDDFKDSLFKRLNDIVTVGYELACISKATLTEAKDIVFVKYKYYKLICLIISDDLNKLKEFLEPFVDHASKVKTRGRSDTEYTVKELFEYMSSKSTMRQFGNIRNRAIEFSKCYEVLVEARKVEKMNVENLRREKDKESGTLHKVENSEPNHIRRMTNIARLYGQLESLFVATEFKNVNLDLLKNICNGLIINLTGLPDSVKNNKKGE